MKLVPETVLEHGISMVYRTGDDIMGMETDEQNRLKGELEELYGSAFPKMSSETLGIFISDYFTESDADHQRFALFFQDQSQTLIGALIILQKQLNFAGSDHNGIYFISNAISPAFHGIGLGTRQTEKVLIDFDPDILFVTCAQSASLHSWVGKRNRAPWNCFDCYPHLDWQEEKASLVNVPQSDRDFIINSFRQLYTGVVQGELSAVDMAVNSLTQQMVRENIYQDMYDFNPWRKHGHRDELAELLGLGPNDGVLVSYRKKTVS